MLQAHEWNIITITTVVVIFDAVATLNKINNRDLRRYIEEVENLSQSRHRLKPQKHTRTANTHWQIVWNWNKLQSQMNVVFVCDVAVFNDLCTFSAKDLVKWHCHWCCWCCYVRYVCSRLCAKVTNLTNFIIKLIRFKNAHRSIFSSIDCIYIHKLFHFHLAYACKCLLQMKYITTRTFQLKFSFPRIFATCCFQRYKLIAISAQIHFEMAQTFPIWISEHQKSVSTSFCKKNFFPSFIMLVRFEDNRTFVETVNLIYAFFFLEKGTRINIMRPIKNQNPTK